MTPDISCPLKYKIKAWFGSLIGLDICSSCGKHNKPKYQWYNNDGDNSTCIKCECGLSWHSWQHIGQ